MSSDSKKGISTSESKSFSELESKCLHDVDASGRATGELFGVPKPAGVAECNKPKSSGPLRLFLGSTFSLFLFLEGKGSFSFPYLTLADRPEMFQVLKREQL